MHHTRKGTKVNRTEHRESIQPSFQPGFNGIARYGLARSGVRSLRLVALFVSAIVIFALTASSALGAQHYSYSKSFGSPGSGAGQFSLSGIALNDATHVLYVADAGNNRVDEFSAAGDFIGAWGLGVADGKRELETCVTTCQVGIGSQELLSGLNRPTYIAVDNSAGSSKGDVYVANDLYGTSVDKFTSTGELVSSWGTDGELNGSTTPRGPFKPIYGIAISASGDLIVLADDYEHSLIRLLYFRESGSFKEELEMPPKPKSSVEQVEARGIALDDSNGPSSGDIYGVAAIGEAPAVKFSATGQFLGELDPESSAALAVDSSNGDVYVSNPADIATYDSAGNPLAKFGSSEESGGELRAPVGLTVDPSNHTVFVADAGSQRIDIFLSVTTPGLTVAPATNIERESVTVAGTVNPGGTTPDAEIKECKFEYVEDSVLQALKGTYSTNEIFALYGSSSACLNPDGSTTAPLAPDTAEHTVHANLSALHPGVAYDFRLLASNVNLTEATAPEAFTTLFQFVAPTIESTFTSGVSSSSAVLEAEVNPNHYQTEYSFEYVDNSIYETDLVSGDGFQHASHAPAGTDAVLGPTGSAQRARQLVTGLAPATTYRYRIHADNGHGEALSHVQSFTTQSAIYGPSLLDGRAWEMVSPPEKSGSLIKGIFKAGPSGILQASADGSGLAYVALGPFGQEAPSSRSFEYSQFLAFRGAGGWSTKDVSTPREDVVGVRPGNTSGYEAFSEDLLLGAVQPRGFTPLSPLATETTPYLRVANGEFVPLVDPLDVPPETVFDGELKIGGSPGDVIEDEPLIEGGSPDLHTVVIASCFKLTEDAVNSCNKGVESLYVWHEGELQLASILPNNKPAAASTGGGSGLGEENLKRHAVSADGTRLIFSVGKQLYLRDMALAETVRLDLPEPGAAGGAEGARFEDMSADGSKVFFTDSERLTTNSNTNNSDPDLYMCEIVVQGEALTCALKDLSVARKVGEAGAVLGDSVGMDSSGRYVYFAANGALTPDAAPGDCDENGAGSGTCGLYLYDTVTGSVRLVTTLSGSDYGDWGRNGLPYLAARVSPNGRFVAFVSQRSLTGYDNRDAVSGKPDVEVYLYDRLGDGGQGKLVCASCDPTGARPHGVEIRNAYGSSLLNEDEIWSPGTWVAAVIPGWTPYSLGEAVYQSRYLSDSGRLFFDSVDALVPRDSNGTTDVYEYEPPQSEGQPASNDCSAASPTYGASSDGCIDLVSSGTSGEESAFLDASESGDDVFFLTGAQLVPGDVDTSLDIYDAGVGGAVSEAAKPPACEGDACQNPVSAPEDPTPGSLTFQGPGNPPPPVSMPAKPGVKHLTRAQKLAQALKACARKPKRKRAACERQARRSYGPVGKAKKSNRRTHR
jgi:DNA-binding beta-propeller fold protein YncE